MARFQEFKGRDSAVRIDLDRVHGFMPGARGEVLIYTGPGADDSWVVCATYDEVKALLLSGESSEVTALRSRVGEGERLLRGITRDAEASHVRWASVEQARAFRAADAGEGAR